MSQCHNDSILNEYFNFLEMFLLHYFHNQMEKTTLSTFRYYTRKLSELNDFRIKTNRSIG